MTCAKDEVLAELTDGENIECVIFGVYGDQGYYSQEELDCIYEDFGFPPKPVPKVGVMYSWTDAQEYMLNWSFNHSYGGINCYPVNIYTNKRILFVSKYDGSTSLVWVNRHPVEGDPAEMYGGG